jgi:hypothetical protein
MPYNSVHYHFFDDNDIFTGQGTTFLFDSKEQSSKRESSPDTISGSNLKATLFL